MIGARVGCRTGTRAGVAAGVSADAPSSSNPMSGVTQDATSGKYFPANATEWAAVMSAAGLSTGNPSALWLCQEASGNLADSIGSISLTAGGTPTYQQTVAGISRQGILLDDGSTDGFSSVSASLPSLASASQMLLAVVKCPAAAPGTQRSIMSIGTSRMGIQMLVTTGRIRVNATSTNADSTGGHADGAIRPLVLRHNRTATEQDGYSELEKVSPVWNTSVAGQKIEIGNGAAFSATLTLFYAASFHGAAAELTDAQVKTLLQTLGWTIAW